VAEGCRKQGGGLFLKLSRPNLITTRPDPTNQPINPRRGLEALVDEGLVRGIGVSNFSIKQVEDILKAARHKPVVNQVGAGWLLRACMFVCGGAHVHVDAPTLTAGTYNHQPPPPQVELHPLLAQRKMVGVLFRQGVACVAYTPLGCPKGGSEGEVLGHPVVKEVAARVGRTPAQVRSRGRGGVNCRVTGWQLVSRLDDAPGTTESNRNQTNTNQPNSNQVLLRYNMQRGVPVIPKASSQPHLAENIAHAFDWRLSNADKAALDAIDSGRRFIDGGWHQWADAEEGGILKPSLVLKAAAATAAAAAAAK
jgi:diketogulonate reductase-like aldo/keto reductase